MQRWIAIAVWITAGGCGGNGAPNLPGDDARPADDARPIDAAPDAPPPLDPGTLQVSWMHGSADCAANADPELQVHSYNATTHIIRQNKCRTFEAPFLYVLVGATSALLFDTGATNNTDTLRSTVRALVGDRPLLVAHTHAHGDHVAGDALFAGQPNTTVVARTQAAIQAAFGIATWPTSQGLLDLGGGRILDVLAIPGHQTQHIALYDRRTGLLFTGDSFYPGLLFISDWNTYRASIGRLRDFAADRPIAHILGAHIEMTATPKQVYPYGTTYQPNEHALPLTRLDLNDLDDALTALGPTPPLAPIAYNHFVVDPP